MVQTQYSSAFTLKPKKNRKGNSTGERSPLCHFRKPIRELVNIQQVRAVAVRGSACRRLLLVNFEKYGTVQKCNVCAVVVNPLLLPLTAPSPTFGGFQCNSHNMGK